MRKGYALFWVQSLLLLPAACDVSMSSKDSGGYFPESSGSTSAPDVSDPDTPAGTPDDAGVFDVDLNSILAGNGGFAPKNLTPKQREDLIEQGRQAGVDIAFNADGIVTYLYPDGAAAVQSADGIIRIGGEDGAYTEIGNDWPDNEYTKLVPKPPFAVGTSFENGSMFTATFLGVAAD